MMENVKKGRKFVSICTKFRFRKSKFSEKQNCRNLPLIIKTPIKERNIHVAVIVRRNPIFVCENMGL